MIKMVDIVYFSLQAFPNMQCFEHHNFPFARRECGSSSHEEAHISIGHPPFWLHCLTFTNFFHQADKLLWLMWLANVFFFLQTFHVTEIKDHFLFHQKSALCSCVPLILHRLYRRIKAGTVWATSWIHTHLLSTVVIAVGYAGCCKSWAITLSLCFGPQFCWISSELLKHVLQ